MLPGYPQSVLKAMSRRKKERRRGKVSVNKDQVNAWTQIIFYNINKCLGLDLYNFCVIYNTFVRNNTLFLGGTARYGRHFVNKNQQKWLTVKIYFSDLHTLFT